MNKQEIKLIEIERDIKSLSFKLYIANKFLRRAIKQGIYKYIDLKYYFDTKGQ